MKPGIKTPLMILVAVTLISSCKGKDENSIESPRPVLSIIAKQTSTSAVRLTGTIEPRVQTELGFRILGRVLSRKVDVGELVKKGQVLASIDPLALELAVRSAQSDLSNAHAQLANAVTTEERQKALAASRSGTEAALEEAEQGRRTAQASVAKAQASLDKAQEQLGYAQLHAEFDGVVMETSAETGQVVSAGQTVLTIAQPDQRDAVIDIPQSAAEHLAVGSRFEVSPQFDPTIRVEGIVREIAPSADSATRSHRTKISLDRAPSSLRLGTVVTASASVKATPRVVLPTSAILTNEKGQGVWIVNTEQNRLGFRQVAVEGELVDGGTVNVTRGISTGERVVVAGVHKIKDGQAIRIDQEVRP